MPVVGKAWTGHGVTVGIQKPRQEPHFVWRAGEPVYQQDRPAVSPAHENASVRRECGPEGGSADSEYDGHEEVDVGALGWSAGIEAH